ncbi:MAG: histidine phosphatase family protein [Bacilli bacterium]
MGQLKKIDTDFTNKGFEQISEISNNLVENNIQIIFTSDFKRAYLTAVLANKERKIKIIKNKSFRGLNMGDIKDYIIMNL